MRIGLFGGTFNPIHLGHLRSVLEIKERFALDRVLLIPSAMPPHKHTGNLADAQERSEMIRRALEGNPQLALCDVEIQRSGISYTIDTIGHLQGQFRPGTQFFLIVGMDAFIELHTWKAYHQLLQCIPFIVMARPWTVAVPVADQRRVLEKFLKEKTPGAYRPASAGHYTGTAPYQSVFFHEVTALAISSSMIRELLRAGRSVRFLVPEAVEQYIAQRGLYS